MHQVTLRLPDELAERLSRAAAERNRSVNAFATAVLRAAVDPDLAGDEATRIRERLAQAGLLAAAPTRRARGRPSRERVRAAQSRAGRGRPLSDFVREGRL